MSVQESYTDAQGNKRTVIADTQEELNEAVKAQKNEGAPVYPNINHPVAKGHDLLAFDDKANVVLTDGTGAHNSPENAVNADGSENGNSDEKAIGLEEPAYKEQVSGDATEVVAPEASKAEVKAAKADAKPANEVK